MYIDDDANTCISAWPGHFLLRPFQISQLVFFCMRNKINCLYLFMKVKTQKDFYVGA